jgi:hypothetical protein
VAAGGRGHLPSWDYLEPIIAVAGEEGFADDALLEVIQFFTGFALLLNGGKEPAIKVGIKNFEPLGDEAEIR